MPLLQMCVVFNTEKLSAGSQEIIVFDLYKDTNITNYYLCSSKQPVKYVIR